MFEKKPLMVENTSVKAWKTPTFHPEPLPTFLYSKETKVLAAPLLRGCLAVEKGKRENDRKMEASVVSFIRYRIEYLQSLFDPVL